MLAVCVVGLVGCATPNPNLRANGAAYDQVACGMSREQVYALLGPPRATQPAGDIDHCRTATWSIPHHAHGWGHWTVAFAGDTVTWVETDHATVTLGR